MNTDEQLIYGDDDNRKVRTLKNDAKKFFWWSLAATVVLGLSAAIVLLIEAFSSTTFDLSLTATTDYRVGSAPSDDYPSRPVLASAGSTNLPLVAGFVSALAFLGFLLLTLWNKQVIDQMEGGASPYLWFTSSLWHFLVFIEIAFFAGITNVFVLTFISLSVFNWLWLFWVNDLLQAPAYVAMFNSASNRMQGGWQWLFWFFGLVDAIVVYVIVTIYCIQTFWQATNTPNMWFSIVPFLGLFLYLAVPIAVILRYGNWGFTATYNRDIFLVIYTFFYALVMTWVPVLITTATP